jgi:hypothetical protein
MAAVFDTVSEYSRSRNSTQSSQRNTEGHGENRESSMSARAVNRFSRFSVCSVLFVFSVLSFAGKCPLGSNGCNTLRECGCASAFFYIHLWVGAGVGLYIVLMSITGSLIVYRNELERDPPCFLRRVDSRPSREPIVRKEWPFRKRHWRDFCDLAVLTGAVIWWPGISNWRRALTVNWRSLFARFSWDLHSALGFWSFLFVLMWGISGSILFSTGVQRPVRIC